jgi:hypothetical protein
MAKHRTHSIEFKRQVAQEFLAGETLHGSPSATAAATGRGGPNRRHTNGSNSWADLAGLFCATRSAFLEHERAKAELKALVPEDAKEATGNGVRAKRSKSGAISFDLLDQRESHAAV